MNRTVTFAGAEATAITGVVANGSTSTSSLVYAGAGSLTLGNSNTFSGGTTLNGSGGTLIAQADGALGAGNVSLMGGAVRLTLQNGATNNYISDTAALSMVTGSTLNLNFMGSDTVGSYVIDGVTQAPGVYNAANVPALITGAGSITIIPEPSTYMLFGLGLLTCAQYSRRKRNSQSKKAG